MRAESQADKMRGKQTRRKQRAKMIDNVRADARVKFSKAKISKAQKSQAAGPGAKTRDPMYEQ
jgi:hypothetical protein